MSLPPARKDISAHPAKGSVTDPVNRDEMHSDVDRKLRFYGVIEAFRAGRLPDNCQIDETLSYIATHSLIDTSQLSPAGRQLANDTKEIIETARQIVKEKNVDELFQRFVWHTRGTDLNAGKGGPIPVTGDQAKANGKEAAHHLRTLLSLLLTNGEVRKLLSDLSVVGRDLLARTADLVRPGEEALARVDEPGAEGEFVRRGETEASPAREEEHLPSAANIPDAVRASAGDTTTKTNHAAVGAQENGTTKDQKQTIKERLAGLKDRVPQEHRDRVGEHFDRAKHFLRDDYFPKERRERFIFRGKKVILECQKHEDYQKSISWLLDTLTAYGEHGKTIATDGSKNAQNVWNDPEFRKATDELFTLLSRFAHDHSTQPARDAAKSLYDDAYKDEELRAWFGKVRAWCRRVLLEPEYVLKKECNSDADSVREEGRKFFDAKYKAHFDALFDALRDWFSAFAQDPLNKRFGQDWARLTRSLLFTQDGTLTWKSELWADIRRVIVPQLIDKVGYIPIPRAEFTDDNLDLVVENLTLSGKNLFPNIVAFEAHNFVKFSPYESIPDETRHEFTLTLGQMQADMRDVIFYFNKKTGVPKLKDSGVADIVVGGEGITATIQLTGAGKDASSVFHVKDVHVKVDSLKFSIRDSKHDALYKILRPLATGIVKRQVQRALHDALQAVLELADERLVKVRDKMQEAKESEDTTRAEALKNLFKREVDEAGTEKEKQAKRHSQFKVVARRDSLLLPEQDNPQGWVNKQQKTFETAKEGREWRSKAFSIVPQA